MHISAFFGRQYTFGPILVVSAYLGLFWSFVNNLSLSSSLIHISISLFFKYLQVVKRKEKIITLNVCCPNSQSLLYILDTCAYFGIVSAYCGIDSAYISFLMVRNCLIMINDFKHLIPLHTKVIASHVKCKKTYSTDNWLQMVSRAYFE